MGEVLPVHEQPVLRQAGDQSLLKYLPLKMQTSQDMGTSRSVYADFACTSSL